MASERRSAFGEGTLSGADATSSFARPRLTRSPATGARIALVRCVRAVRRSGGRVLSDRASGGAAARPRPAGGDTAGAGGRPRAPQAVPPPRALLLLLAGLAAAPLVRAQDTELELCTGCHDTPAFEPELFARSAHGRLDCSACHADLAGVEEFPHATDLEPVACTDCHDDDDGPIAALRASVHGDAIDCALCHTPHAIGTELEGARDACTRCHEGARASWQTGAHAYDPRPPGRTGDPVAAPEPRGADCVDCHGGHAVQPADEALAPDACSRCHAEPVAQWTRSVHGGDPGNGSPAARCSDCHGGVHAALALSDPRSPVHPLNLPDTCESCHRPDPSPEHPAPGGEKASQYESSVHGRALRELGLVVTATCSSCHGAHDVLPAASPDAPTARAHVPNTCGECHAGILLSYLDGVHGSAFLDGVEDVPVCNDCHAEHAVADPALAGSSVSRELVAETCARCHANDELAQRYGFSASVRRSWGDSYHGIAAKFGESSVANCASCHGFHAVLPSSDPRSPVHPANLDETCGSCHAGAGEAFARVPVHSVIERDANPVPWWVQRIYAWLVGGLIGAFALFIVVDIFGRLRIRLGLGPPETEHVDPHAWPDEDALVAPGERFRRMGRHARLQHGLLIVSFSLLVLTGIPVFLHDVPWMRSLIDLEGGYALRSVLHRLAALVLIGLSVWHVAVMALSGGARRWFATMMFRPRDVTDFVQDLAFSLGIFGWIARSRRLAPLVRRFPWLRFDRRPVMGRYGLVEKLEYGAVLWGNVVMILTGLILWRPDWFLAWTPSWTFEVSRIVHGFEATLAFLAIIIWHMYHVHLRPGVFPMSRVWLDGDVTREELRHHHPGEYLAILARRRAERGGARDETGA